MNKPLTLLGMALLWLPIAVFTALRGLAGRVRAGLGGRAR